MSAEVKEPFTVIAVYLWIGFVAAISFMEAWLKFRAPGVNLQIGLGIGRLVFNALNKVEWVLAASVCISLLLSRQAAITTDNAWYYFCCLLLILQTFWLLPVLDQRAGMHLRGLEVPSSSLHIWYVVMEVLKVSSLIIFGFKQFK